MASSLPLNEAVQAGDPLPALLRDLAYYANRGLYVATTRTADTVTTALLDIKLAADLVTRFGLRADGTITMGEAPLAVSTVAGTSTVTVTTTASHGYGTGDIVVISGVAGYSGANGTHTITVTGAATFTLDGVTGSGTYTSGGTVQRNLGGTGSANEGVWNLVMGDTTRDGLVVRGKIGSTKNLALFRDYAAAVVFAIQQIGGAGLFSALVTDVLFATDSVSGRKFAANTAGGARLAAGDPAGGVDVLAVGNAGTPPTAGQSPDGTHTADGSFATAAGVVLWARGGRLRLRGSAGHEDELLAPVHRRALAVTAPGAGTTLVSTGTAAPTVATTNITAAADDQAAGPGVSYTTTAASGVDAGVLSAFGVLQPRWAPLFYARLTTDASAVTSTRLAAGLVSAEIATDAGPAATGAYTVAAGAWLRYDTAVDGTAFWRAVTASGTNATVTTTTAAIAAATAYELLVECNAAGTSWRFWVGGTLVATHTTNLPATTAALGYTARLRTLAASARALRLGRLTMSGL